MKIQHLQKAVSVISYFNLIIWIFLGFLTIGSFFTETRKQFFIDINLIVGLIFIGIGYLGFSKSQNSSKLVKIINSEELLNSTLKLRIQKLLLGEFVLIIISTFIGIAFSAGAIFRIFKENLPVFG